VRKCTNFLTSLHPHFLTSKAPLPYLWFFCSGLSGLIYQVVWVREFGNVFGNTIYSTSLVVAVFMLGLGVGSYLVGRWADRRYAARPESLLSAYGYIELLIGVLGFGIAALLPRLGEIAALATSYARDTNGWYVLSAMSYVARVGIAVVLLTPITVLMGGTLTLLIRHLVRSDLEIGGRRIAFLYAVNTAGAALGCFLTDFALVPAFGLRATQMVAVGLNVVAGVGALFVAQMIRSTASAQATAVRRPASDRASAVRRSFSEGGSPQPSALSALAVPWTCLTLAMCGFAAMGMEILWFRHFTILLGGFRAVFSLLLTVILIGIGAGSLLSGLLRPARPAHWLMVVQGLFIAFSLLGLAVADASGIERAVMADRVYQAAAGSAAALGTSAYGWTRPLADLWFNARPILFEVGLPALLMGFSFPLANAMIQRRERSVGRHAGVLYFSNTVGAVCGSLAAGFLFLPLLGIQGSATVLMMTAGLAVVPLHLATRPERPLRERAALACAILIGGVALGLWCLLPPAYLLSHAAPPFENERVLASSEGLTEVIAVTESPGRGRTLVTNGHPMSSDARLSQRYMRALAHIPLLSIDNPEIVLVIGFGVGNTTHAATLHPSIQRVEVADLSRGILAHAGYFKDANRDVLNDPRVVVYVNDGRHHLRMQRPGSYDLIALEPPPIGYAGVAALYSTEFYALARTRLKPKGYISQWLPAYQVPPSTTLAMIRAFVEVFPQAVLISGAEADLLLLGANDSRIEIDPDRIATGLSKAPAVLEDLRRLDLGSVREIVGAFIGSAQKLADATRDTAPVRDDRPVQEYGVRSLLDFDELVPASVVDLAQVGAWCPRCFAAGKPVPVVDGLDTYMALLERAYSASPVDVSRVRSRGDRQSRLGDHKNRLIAGSAYLGAIVPESADLHNLLGVALADKGQFDGAIVEFRHALRIDPDSAKTYWHLGAALASQDAREEAIGYLRRSVQLDSSNGLAHYDLGGCLLAARQLDGAVEEFRAAIRLMPNSVEAHNNLGLSLALEGRLDEAIDEFQRALTFDPEFAGAQRNLTIALRQRRPNRAGPSPRDTER
jgi:spermidine synthase